MYFAHLHPLVFPMNKSIFTGKVPVHQYREEHALEYAQIMAAAGLPLVPAEEATTPIPAEAPAAREPSAAEPGVAESA
jgi:hypothetical protein